MDPGIRQDFWAPAYRRGDAGFGDYGLLKFRCVYRDIYSNYVDIYIILASIQNDFVCIITLLTIFNQHIGHVS